MINFFQTHTMTLQHSNNTVVAQHLPAQLDTVNIPFNMDVGGWIPDDSYDLYSLGWISPVPIRGDYFVDEADPSGKTKYSVFGNPAVYFDHIECRLTKYAGTTP